MSNGRQFRLAFNFSSSRNIRTGTPARARTKVLLPQPGAPGTATNLLSGRARDIFCKIILPLFLDVPFTAILEAYTAQGEDLIASIYSRN
jgi:hypothetical protein